LATSFDGLFVRAGTPNRAVLRPDAPFLNDAAERLGDDGGGRADGRGGPRHTSRAEASIESGGPGAAQPAFPWWARARRRARARSARLVGGGRSRPRSDGLGVEAVGAIAAVVVVVAVLFGVVVLAIVLLAGAAGRVAWLRRATALVDRRRRAQLPEALERMAAALRTGSSPPQALAEAARGTAEPLGPELDALSRQASRGQPLVTVLDGWTALHPDRGTRLAAVALALASGVGAVPARALDGVATTLRERLELADERHALATQARASAVVLSAAPPVFAALLTLGDPEASRFLLQSPPGWLCIALGVGLDVVGAVWMTRLTRGDAA
jgi:tight adherence protein B